MDQFQENKNQASVMTFGEWMITILITAIPLVNIIMLIVWAVSSTDNPNRINWARATLAWFAILIVLYGIMAIAMFGIFASM